MIILQIDIVHFFMSFNLVHDDHTGLRCCVVVGARVLPSSTQR